MLPPKRLVAAVGLAALLVTAGCVSGPLSETEEQQLADAVTTELADVDAYEATVTTSISIDGENTTSMTRQVHADVENNHIYAETLTPEAQDGDLLVTNDTATWRFDASENQATRYENAGATRSMANLTTMFDDVADRFNITINGTETVAGVDAHVVELTPTDTNAASMTVWANPDTYFPVQVKQTFTTGDSTYVATTTYANATLNPDFEPGLFDFEPPADASVDTVTLPETETVTSKDALRATATQSVASPDIPTDFAFERGTVLTDDGNESVTATYTNDTATLRVTQQPPTDYAPSGESITINGHNATLTTFGDSTAISWTCSDTRYTVAGAISESLARATATSITC